MKSVFHSNETSTGQGDPQKSKGTREGKIRPSVDSSWIWISIFSFSYPKFSMYLIVSSVFTRKERTTKLPLVISVAFQLLRVVGSLALTIEPGIGFVPPKTGQRVVIFEHTEHGSGGLVWNRPTPVVLGNLNIPRFQKAFSKHSLMLGCGTESSGSESNIRIGDMAPWFWLHNVPDLEGSFRLEGAKGQLFMGGNIEKATEILQNSIGRYQFKFFWKYKLWEASELMEEIASGEWENVEPQDADEVLQPFSITVSK